MIFWDARLGDVARIQEGVYRWLGIRRIRIAPFYIRPGHNSPIDCISRTTDVKLTEWGIEQCTKRIMGGGILGDFVEITLKLRRYVELNLFRVCTIPICEIWMRSILSLTPSLFNVPFC